MRKPNRHSLAFHIISVLVIVLTSALIIFGSFDYYREVDGLKRAKLDTLRALGRSTSAAIRTDIYNNNYITIEQELSALSGIAELDRIVLYDPAGLIMAELARDEKGELYPTYRYGRVDNPGDNAGTRYDDEDNIVSKRAINFAGGVIAWLELYSDRSHLQLAKQHIFNELIILLSIILFTTGFVLYWYIRGHLENIKALTMFAKSLPEFSDKNLHIKNAPNEIQELADSLNWASQEIASQRRDLLMYSEDLEAKIAERTRELVFALEESNKADHAKSEFLSQMSHELRTPLNAILGYAQIMTLDENELNEQHKSSVEEILSAGWHLLTLISDILDLSKIEAGKLEINISHVDSDTMLKEALSLVSLKADERNISIFDKTTERNCLVNADPVRLKQVLVNILSNAIKYNSNNGSVIISNELRPHKRLRICITDTGEGISEEDYDRLFTSFERLHPVNNVEGTGIGLVITKCLLDLMGGTIGVESNSGEGSTFWIEIPLAEGQ